MLGVLLAAIGTVGVGVEGVWAQAKVNITREESKPNPVATKAGETVQFINNTGGTAHVMFAGNDAYSTWARAKAGSSSRSPARTSPPCT